MKKTLTAILATIVVTPAILIPFSTPAKALSFGEALGIGAGAVLINQTINNNRQRYRFVPPEQEHRRGLEDGFNRARYDNPRDSGDYDRGFIEGRRRANAGWRSPFQK